MYIQVGCCDVAKSENISSTTTCAGQCTAGGGAQCV